MCGGDIFPLFGVANHETKNYEKNTPQPWHSCHSMEIHINQPKVGGSDGLEVGAIVSLAMRVGWDVILSFGPSK